MEKSWVYFDTSVFLKLYVREKGSEEARKIARKSFILSSAILPAEAFSALTRKRLSGEIEEGTFNTLLNRIKKDLQYIEFVRLVDEVLQKVEDIVLNSPYRTLDAIHIASALIFEETSGINLKFVTSDKRQYEIARQHLSSLFIGR